VDEGLGRTAAVAAAVHRVRSTIAAACARAGRDPEDVTLVAVTKTVPIDLIRVARAEGIADFGENRAKDLETKAAVVDATWHFVGRLQTGTARKVADAASVVHSAEPGRALPTLARRAAEHDGVITCLAQVDFTGTRQGVGPEQLEEFLRVALRLDGLRFAGLMTLPPFTQDPEEARPFFALLRRMRDALRERWPDLVELSMGMSRDYAAAVEEGATMVRVGTALFGERPAKQAKPADPAPSKREP
jgi:PLP dependent protein